MDKVTSLPKPVKAALDAAHKKPLTDDIIRMRREYVDAQRGEIGPRDAPSIPPRRVVPERGPNQIGSWEYLSRKHGYIATPLTRLGWIVALLALGMFALVAVLASVGVMV